MFEQAAFDRAYAECAQLLVEGKLDRSGRLSSAAGGAAASGAAVAVGGATAVAVAGYAGLAVVAATVVLLPFAAIGGAIGMSKMKREERKGDQNRGGRLPRRARLRGRRMGKGQKACLAGPGSPKHIARSLNF